MTVGAGSGQPTRPAWAAFADALLGRATAVQNAEAGPAATESTSDGSDAVEAAALVAAADEAIETAREHFAAAFEEPEPFTVLARNAGLTLGEAEVFALAAAVEADRRSQLLVARLQHDTQLPRLTLHGLVQLFAGEHVGVRAVSPDSALRRSAFIEVIDEGSWSSNIVRVHPSVMWALTGDVSTDPDLPVGTELVAAPDDSGDHELVAVTGPDRVRRLHEATRAAIGDRFLVTPHPANQREWEAVVREATIVGAGIVVEIDEELAVTGRRCIQRSAHLTWVLSSPVELPIEPMPDRPWVDRHATSTEPTDAEWADALGEQTPRSHRLTPAQLRVVSRAYGAVDGDLDAAVRRLAGGHIDRLARRVRPERSWDDLVLSPDRLELLHDLVARYRHGDTVYDDWGFSARPSRGLIALFSGPSGTGKTLAAEIVAGDLGLDMYKLELSAVVSKYIGETEKNLDRVFDAASAGNVVLFFDEADALFGKRSEVRDARDRYANIEVSYLLQRMEAYDGVVVLATNFERNIDDAFLRRIQTRVSFPLPEVEERRTIWEQNLPAGAPVAPDVDTERLAQQFEMSGASIRNATVQAAFAAVANGTKIDMDCVLLSIAREYQKLGRLINVDDADRGGGRPPG